MSFNRENGTLVMENKKPQDEEILKHQFLLEKKQLDMRKEEIKAKIDRKKKEIKLNQEEKELQLQERELELVELNRKVKRLTKRLQTGKELSQSLQQENEIFKRKVDLLNEENDLLNKENNTLIDCMHQSFISDEQLIDAFSMAAHSKNGESCHEESLLGQSLELYLQSVSQLEGEIKKQTEEIKSLEQQREQAKKDAGRNSILSSEVLEEYQQKQIIEENARKLLEEKLYQQAEQINKIKEIFDEAQEGDAFEKLADTLQTKFAVEQEHSQTIQLKLLELEAREGQLEEKSMPLFNKHQLEENKQAVQKKIVGHPNTRSFYNTFYQIFSAKITAAILLTSDLIKPNDRMTNSVAEFGATLTSNMMSSVLPIPILGAVFATVAGRMVKGIADGIKNNIQEKKVHNAADSVIAVDLATELASVTATKLTQVYEEKLLFADHQGINKAAEYCAHMTYNFIKSGQLLTIKDCAIEEKTNVLLKEIRDKKWVEEGLQAPKKTLMDKVACLFHRKKNEKANEGEGAECGLEENDLPSYEEIVNQFQIETSKLEKSQSASTVVKNVHHHYKNSNDTARVAKGTADFALKHSAITQENLHRMLKNQAQQIATQQEKISFLEKEYVEQKTKLDELTQQINTLTGFMQTFALPSAEKPIVSQMVPAEKKNINKLNATQKSLSSPALPIKQASLFVKSTSQKNDDLSQHHGFLRMKTNSSKFKVGSV